MVVRPSAVLACSGWLTASISYPFFFSSARNSFSAFWTASHASSKLVNSFSLGLHNEKTLQGLVLDASIYPLLGIHIGLNGPDCNYGSRHCHSHRSGFLTNQNRYRFPDLESNNRKEEEKKLSCLSFVQPQKI
jgi:hypothetical protein